MNFKPRPDIPPSLYMALTESVYQDELAKYFRSLPEQSKKLKAFSATTLPRAPRQRVLEARWGKDLVVDPVRERFWSMWGQLTHLLLEKNAREGDLIEKRLGWDVGPFPDGSFIHIHGQPDALYMSDYDLVENGELLASVKAGDMDDWKVTSALNGLRWYVFDCVFRLYQIRLRLWLFLFVVLLYNLTPFSQLNFFHPFFGFFSIIAREFCFVLR